MVAVGDERPAAITMKGRISDLSLCWVGERVAGNAAHSCGHHHGKLFLLFPGNAGQKMFLGWVVMEILR